MKRMVRVRKEIVLCSKCKSPNVFLYLSDFSYGEKLLVLDEGKYYAYINLFEDDSYGECEDIVRKIYQRYNIEITKKCFVDAINIIFDITCDKIYGHTVSFKQKKRKCIQCLASDFDNILVEPETFENIDVPIVTHNSWRLLDKENKIERIEKKLIENGLLN